MNEILKSMSDCLRQGPPVYLPSKFWEEFNEKNIGQLDSEGIQNFKRTLALNYFTWVIGKSDQQFRNLLRHTKPADWPSVVSGVWDHDASCSLTRRQQLSYGLFTRMLWRFAERFDSERILQRVSEPLEGHPFKIHLDGRLISQDLANSVLEYYSMRERWRHGVSEKPSICELGAGYGRNAYVFLKHLPRCKYIIVDIPPALGVSQHYLSSVLPDKKIFSFRCFKHFGEIDREFLNSDVAFLLPHQAEMLPPKTVDLFVNISSLQEMTREQIHAYFRLIDRLTRGFFYSKQWLVSRNPADNITITAEDYPVPPNWRELYHRKAKVQSYFFEAMYEIGEY